MADVLLLSPWTEPVRINPSYQYMRDEINHYASEVARVKLREFLSAQTGLNPERYTQILRYQHQYPFMPGLLSLAAVLEADGYEVRCVSLDIERDRCGATDGWLERVVSRLGVETTLAVAITAVTPEIDRALRVLETFKTYFPYLLTIIGGTHVTYEDLVTAACPWVDVVVRGEGEETLLEILARRRIGHSLKGVAGVTLRIDGQVNRAPDRPLTALENLPMPAYHLLDAETRSQVVITPTYSRGCPHTCNYCVESIFWDRRVRYKNPDRFVDELQYIAEQLDFSFIHIADSTFGVNRRQTAQLCDALERRRLNAVFSVNLRPDVFGYLGEELVRRLISLGFVEFYVGYESASEDVIKSANRQQNESEFLDTLRRLKAMGALFVKVYLMIGIPGDTHASLQRTLNTVRELLEQDLIYYAASKYFVPTPGTEPFARAFAGKPLPQGAEWGAFERYNFPPVVPHESLSPLECETYLLMLQAIQLKRFRQRAKAERDTLQELVSRTYLKKMYL